MSEAPLPSDLVTRLREFQADTTAHMLHRAAFQQAADCIEQLQMPHAEVLRLAEREDGADALALVTALYRKVEAQKREITRLQQRCKWYADSQDALRAKVCRQNDVDERGGM